MPLNADLRSRELGIITVLARCHGCTYPSCPQTTMALNWTMLDMQRTPVPLAHESVIMTVDDGAELILSIPNAPPAPGASAGGSGGSRKLKGMGKIYLTDQRLIFVSPPNPSFDSLSVPLSSILMTKFEQPVFGSNYVLFDIKPTTDGGLTEGTRAELRLKDRALFQFVGVLEKARERSIYMKRQAESEADTLPLYESPSATRTPEPRPSTSRAEYTSIPEPGELPPGYDA